MAAGALFLISFSIALSVPSLAIAEEKPPVRHYAWETVCRHPLPEEADFTAQEVWAWNTRLCLGKVAKMSDYGDDDGKGCEAKEANTWPETRRLSEKFLRTILFHEPFKSAPPSPHIHIRCALFDEKIDLSNFNLKNEVFLDQSRFKQKVDLRNLRAQRTISFYGSFFDHEILLRGAKIDGQFRAIRATFEGPFSADVFEVEGGVSLDGSNFKGVGLVGAKIGFLTAKDATFEGQFTADDFEVEGAALFDGSNFNGVDIHAAKIDGSLSAGRATFVGPFTASSLEVKGNLVLDGAHFKPGEGRALVRPNMILFGPPRKAFVDLAGAKIDSQLSARGAKFDGTFNAEDVVVKGAVFLDDNAVFQGPLHWLGGTFNSSVNIDGSTFHDDVMFTGTTIAKDLILASQTVGPKPPTWKDGAKLILRNVSVGALQESRAAWCRDGKQDTCDKNDSGGFVPVDLQGFTYQRLGGLESTGPTDAMARRSTEWMLAWLGAQPGHSSRYIPQPYTHLAKVLRETGNPAKADEILYGLREQERTAANTSWPKYLWLTLQKYVIGYGYNNELALFWFALLVLAGVWLSSKAAETDKLTELTDGQKVWYSLDRALPLVNLGATEGVDPPSNWVAYYFYVHRIIGFVLATFLVAGLSGLTK